MDSYTLTTLIILRIVADGGVSVLDWMHGCDVDDAAPLCVILPGLTGDSSCDYVKYLALAASGRCRVVVANHRGAANKLETARMYSAAATEDISFVIDTLHHAHPVAPIIAVGISLGGIILTKYLGQRAASTPVTAAL